MQNELTWFVVIVLYLCFKRQYNPTELLTAIQQTLQKG